MDGVEAKEEEEDEGTRPKETSLSRREKERPLWEEKEEEDGGRKTNQILKSENEIEVEERIVLLFFSYYMLGLMRKLQDKAIHKF